MKAEKGTTNGEKLKFKTEKDTTAEQRRKLIIEALQALSTEHGDDVSTRMIGTYLRMRGYEFNLIGIGNNMRVLKQRGMVSMKVFNGKRWWGATNKPYFEEVNNKILLAVPVKTYQMIKDLAKQEKLNVTAFILKMLTIGIDKFFKKES